MPLASFYSLPWYGPGAAAMVVEAPATVVADIKGTGRVEGSLAGSASVPLAKPTRLVNSPAVMNGAGSMPQALPKGRARAASVIRIGELSQDDVTGAVLTARIEGGYTLRDALRLLLAVNVGKTSEAAGTWTFRDTADTKDRVIGTIVGGERTSVTLDPS